MKGRCLSRLKRRYTLFNPVSKIPTMMGMNIEINKGIYPDFARNVLDGCRDDHDDLSLVDLEMYLMMNHIQGLPSLNPVLICLDFSYDLLKVFVPSSSL